MEVIYEDNHLLAVNKRPGDIVQGDKTGDEPLSETVKHWLREKYGKTGNIFCGVIHRIDRPVSGVVIFAKTSKALSRMNQLIQDRQVHKKYWAVVKNLPPQPHGNLVHYLHKIESQNKSIASDTPKNGYLRAELNYAVVASSDFYHLLEIELITGRHHQIRSQLAAMDCPIKGDLKYGFPRPNPDASISLHARSICFVHPVSQLPTHIEAAPPNDKLWNCLAETLQNANV
ncbi:MAG: RluA family pseudouridine synthase [Lentimicrobiaceae bacterium]|nr:RluA family pseudouridine synthase [Lentimicrobiaceae bacterium]